MKGRWQQAMEGRGWNSLYFNNHDQPRAVSRFGDPENYRFASATMLPTFLHMLQGTPYVYQGEELGMTNVSFDAIAHYRDIETINGFTELVENQGIAPDEALKKIHFRSRDNARTPMQWTTGPNAGFTTGTPWLALNPNHATINAEAELADPASIFHYYQRLIRLRKEHPVIVYGRYQLIEESDPDVYAFTRSLDDDELLVIANFSAGRPTFEMQKPAGTMLVGNYPISDGETDAFALQPYEARVYLKREGHNHRDS